MISKLQRGAVLIIAALFLICGGSPAAGEPTQGVHAYVHAGAGYTFGELSKQSDFGLAAGIALGITPVERSSDIEFVLRGTMNLFPRRRDDLHSIQTLGGGLDLKLNLGRGDHLNPYLLLGCGYARMTIKAAKTGPRASGDFTENNFFGSPGLGIEIGRKGKVRWFLETRFTDISGSYLRDYQFLALSVGIKK
ncbi:MAG: outer membrane beta-barrel protein [Candidatus Zixiibacteriota bacterium]